MTQGDSNVALNVLFIFFSPPFVPFPSHAREFVCGEVLIIYWKWHFCFVARAPLLPKFNKFVLTHELTRLWRPALPSARPLKLQNVSVTLRCKNKHIFTATWWMSIKRMTCTSVSRPVSHWREGIPTLESAANKKINKTKNKTRPGCYCVYSAALVIANASKC